MTASRPSPLRRILLVCLCLLLLAAAGAALTACSDSPSLPAPSLPVPVYDLDVTYDGERTVTLAQELIFTAAEPLDDIRLHLYPNAFSEDAPAPPCTDDEREETYYAGESFGNIDVLSVVSDGQTVGYDISADGGILVAHLSAGAGETVFLRLEAVIALPVCNARFGVSEGAVNLTAFYPSLCFREDGEWRQEGYSPVGDPFLSDISSFYVTVTAPERFIAAASGETVSSRAFGTERVTEIAAENVRDFALFLSPSFSKHTATAVIADERVSVRYFSLTDPDPQDTLRLAVRALEVFSETFGAYPYPAFTLVQSDIGGAGMEYGALAALSADAHDRDVFRTTVVHETAHQWWFGVVGSDQILHPWQDEGLAEFSAAWFFLLTGDSASYDAAVSDARAYLAAYTSLPAEIGFDNTLDRPLSSFLTAGEYTAVAYCKGMLFFHDLRTSLGDDALTQALASYYSENAFTVASPADLARALRIAEVPRGAAP